MLAPIVLPVDCKLQHGPCTEGTFPSFLFFIAYSNQQDISILLYYTISLSQFINIPLLTLNIILLIHLLTLFNLEY